VGLAPDECRPKGLARRLGVSRDVILRWLRHGWLNARRDGDGHHVIWADAAELDRLRELRRALRDGARESRLEKLKKPNPRPAR
jgi:DNA-binding transcriptional MerR regulator